MWPSGNKFYFLRLSETATLHATDQFEYEDIEARRDALVEEMMRRIAHHFGMTSSPFSLSSLGQGVLHRP